MYDIVSWQIPGALLMAMIMTAFYHANPPDIMSVSALVRFLYLITFVFVLWVFIFLVLLSADMMLLPIMFAQNRLRWGMS